jgi:hypothetical protein
MLAVLASSELLLSTRQQPANPDTTRHAATVVPPASEVTPMQQRQILKAYGKLPLRFEANAGQTDPQVQFLVRGSGSTLFLTATEAVLAVHGPEGTSPVRMQLVGANPMPHVRGEDALPGTSNYFIGNDPQQWHTAVPSYAKVVYDAIYPGVDLVYYGTQGRVEHDFIVAPGTSPSVIALEVHGADQMAIDAQGDLVMTTGAGDVRLQKPVLYQEVEGQRRDVAGGYVLMAEQRVGFQMEAYDATWPLVIDPVLVYATYLGGRDFDRGSGIAVDTAGYVYVTGDTRSLNFPVAGSSLQPTFDGAWDAFVAKLNPAGSSLVYATYLGGSGGDTGWGIAVDTAGQAYVAGDTTSRDLPIAGNPLQATLNGSSDAFVAKLNAAGSALLYATYLGGSASDGGAAIAVDASGNTYVTGRTTSRDLPVAGNPLQPTFGGGFTDVFVAKLNAAGSALVYATYLGGSGEDDPAISLAVDAAGQAYVTGETTSRDFPVAGNPLQATLNGGSDAFVAKLNAVGSALLYATYLGGSEEDRGIDLAVDTAGNTYITGRTTSRNFPVAGSPLQATFGGGFTDAFVAKLDTAGSTLVYATYLGGSGVDTGLGIAVDAAGQAYVTGDTYSLDFPVAGSPLQETSRGLQDAFVAKLNAAGSALLYATYLGGSGYDVGYGIAVDAAGQAFVTGYTNSDDFPVAGSPFQARNGGSGSFDAFVAKLGTEDTLPPAITITATPETLWPPNGKLVTVTVSGTITDEDSAVDEITATYEVTDEYDSIHLRGPVTVDEEDDEEGKFVYTFTIRLQASRNGNDPDGRQYTVTVRAQDFAGNTGLATAYVTVPHDQGQGRSIAAR